MRNHRTVLAVIGILAALCVNGVRVADEPFFDGLGSYQRPVTTRSPEAQKYFNQGLAFLQGFNHGEAIRSFQAAAQADPQCAMAHWGIAYACGPHINLPAVPPPAAELAWKELALARESAANASPVEKDLIEALGHRYANPQPDDRAPLDRAYADAMRRVWQAHGDDPDVGAWFAESLMDLRPWNQWTPAGVAQPGTEEVVATLDAVLKLNVNHPLANHLYIHALEASPNPDRANAAADRLRDLQPGVAHNVHMPSHIDIRCGRWQQAIDTNLKAIEADRKYRQVVGPPKGFIIIYVAHNQQMLTFAAMMCGQSDLAIKHARAMLDGVPEDFVKDNAPKVEAVGAMPLEVLVRFGRWDEILAAPDVARDYMPFTRAARHACRAIAFAAKGEPTSARAEQAIYLQLAALIPPDEMAGLNNPASSVCSVMTPMVDGEILVAEGSTEKGIARLREAVKAEDALRYEEPPAWLIPARQSLGAVLVKSGNVAEAERVYRDDLAHHPENGWSLYGLSESLRRQGKSEEAEAVTVRFKKTWANADIPLKTSCLCQPEL